MENTVKTFVKMQKKQNKWSNDLLIYIVKLN